MLLQAWRVLLQMLPLPPGVVQGAPDVLPYNPNDGEGVQVWKLSHGYADIQGGRH